MIPVEYSTNNSGGDYWLDDKAWSALKEAGWKIFKLGEFAYDAQGNYVTDPDGLPAYADTPDYRTFDVYHDAYKYFDSITDALQEFETLTGANVSDEGCNCCGAPHAFTWGKDIIKRVSVKEQDYNYASGEELLEYLYPTVPTSLTKRELLEKLASTASVASLDEDTKGGHNNA